jgi:hypothetical protein
MSVRAWWDRARDAWAKRSGYALADYEYGGSRPDYRRRAGLRGFRRFYGRASGRAHSLAGRDASDREAAGS